MGSFYFSFFFIWLQMWPDLIQKAKDGGLDVIQTYVFWNGHEPTQGNVMIINYIYAFSLSFFSAFFCEKIFWVQRLLGVYLIFEFLCFSIIFRTGMILFDSSSWCSKQGFMFISGLALMFVLNGIMGNNYST